MHFDIEGLSRLWALSHSRIPVEMPSTIDDPIENSTGSSVSNSVEPLHCGLVDICG